MNIISNLIEAHIFRVENGNLEFLLLKRSPEQYYPNLWQMVSGKIKEHEKAFEAVIREVKEETNLEIEKLWVAPTVNSFYAPDNDSICLLPVFAIKVGSKSKVQLSNEHVAFKWVSQEEAKKHLAWEGQRKSVDVIADYFLNRNSFLNFIEIKNIK
jgi:dATP pyrophosphohydrolase